MLSTTYIHVYCSGADASVPPACRILAAHTTFAGEAMVSAFEDMAMTPINGCLLRLVTYLMC